MNVFNFLLITLLVLASVFTVLCEKYSFSGYQLLQLSPSNDIQKKIVHQMENDYLEVISKFDVWEVHRNSGKVDVLLPPNSISNFTQIFDKIGLKYAVLDLNIQNKIEEQERSMIRSKDSSKNILFKYARYSEILSFIDDTVNSNIDIASSYIAGTTIQNRQLRVIKLKVANALTNQAIWIDCGIHAREWVSPATCVFIIDQLLKEYRDGEPGNLLSSYEVHIMPLVNPDGYEYTHNTFRLWRKNRSTNTGSSCIGTDLNRNFPYGWMVIKLYLTLGGSSTDPCSDIYAGKAASSENETKAIISAITAKQGSWVAFITLHSYGNWWLLPYGNTNAIRPQNYNDLMEKGRIGAAAIKAYKNQGQIFTVGATADILYINSGSSRDWAKGDPNINIQYSYTLELRPGEGQADGAYGFTLPEDRMPLVAPETFAGIRAFINAI